MKGWKKAGLTQRILGKVCRSFSTLAGIFGLAGPRLCFVASFGISAPVAKRSRRNSAWSGRCRPRVLLAGGLGYRNVGDEAQMGASLQRWRRLLPEANLLVFSPDPWDTACRHRVDSTWAPRIVWFRSDILPHYFRAGVVFRFWFLFAWMRQTVSARMLRAGFPLLICNAAEARLLRTIRESDALHISGGGFLTGMTKSRLWETGLLMRLCKSLDVPYFLTGQTIGVFKSQADRRIARKALAGARLIFLRDYGRSETELQALGVSGNHVQSDCDDALFSDSIPTCHAISILEEVGINVDRPYAIANCHDWGQRPDLRLRVLRRFAALCDYLVERHSMQILFLPMAPCDEEPEKATMDIMKHPAIRLRYEYDHLVARGMFKKAALCLTMKHHPIIFSYAESVSVVSVALDEYYYQKNRGAMDHCGHGDLCLDEAAFFSNQAESALDSLVNDSHARRASISQWLDEVRSRDGEAIARFCAMSEKSHCSFKLPFKSLEKTCNCPKD